MEGVVWKHRNELKKILELQEEEEEEEEDYSSFCKTSARNLY
jgi:hypothetical protein